MSNVTKFKKKASNGRVFTKGMSKEELFIHYLDIRMDKLKIALKNIGNLANTRTYTYTDSQKQKVLSVIKKWHENMRAEWLREQKKKDKRKTFSEEQGW